MRRNELNRKKALIILLIAVVLIAVFGVCMHLIEKHGLKDIQFGDTGDWGGEDDEIYLTFNDKDYISRDDVNAYLIAGTDAGGEDLGEGYNGELADFITVLLIDNTTKKYAFYQVDRNTMVDMAIRDASGDYSNFALQQICLAHWYGVSDEERNENLCNSTSDVLGGVELEGYYVLSMKDIGAVNNAIGGVTVDIDTDMTKLDPAFVKGTSVRLTDDQAEKFLRARSNVGGGTNAERMARQTQYMQKAYNLIINQLRENPEYINDLYDQLEDKVQSDGTGKRMSVITRQLIEYENQGIITFAGKTELGDTIGEGIEHEEFYRNEEAVMKDLSKVMNIEEDTSSDDDEEDEDYEEDEEE